MKKARLTGRAQKEEGNIMKKAILGVCAVTLALALAACGSAPASEPAEADYTAYTLQFDVPEEFAQLEEPPEGVSAMFQARTAPASTW